MRAIVVRGTVTNLLSGGDGERSRGRHSGVILYPYGQPQRADHAELCSRFAFEAGGDLGRIIDGPFPTLDRFIEFASRLHALRKVATASQRPLVVLTRTTPVALVVVNARRKIEAAVSGLQHAVWAVFVDPVEDPFFFATLASLGRLEGSAEEVSAWYAPDERPYIVVTPAVERVSEAARAVLEGD